MVLIISQHHEGPLVSWLPPNSAESHFPTLRLVEGGVILTGHPTPQQLLSFFSPCPSEVPPQKLRGGPEALQLRGESQVLPSHTSDGLGHTTQCCLFYAPL